MRALEYSRAKLTSGDKFSFLIIEIGSVYYYIIYFILILCTITVMKMYETSLRREQLTYINDHPLGVRRTKNLIYFLKVVQNYLGKKNNHHNNTVKKHAIIYDLLFYLYYNIYRRRKMLLFIFL